MKILHGRLGEIPRLEGRWCVSLGTFDGVHLGHQALLGEARSVAARSDVDGAVAVSFGRHPRSVLHPEAAPDRLSSQSERAQLIAATGIDALVVLEFDEELSQLSYDAFVREILIDRLGMVQLVLGHDVHFGRGRAGTLHTVAELAEREGFGLSQVASVRYAEEPISSTRLRATIRSGDLEDASGMLGHPYLLRGVVELGRRLGRTLGWPTANLRPDHPRKLIPAVGVYGGWARRPGGGWRVAVTNVGNAPTVEDPVGAAPRIETHLVGETGEFYGESLEVLLARRLRPERRFEGLEALSAAIEGDVSGWEQTALELSPDVHFSRVGDPVPDALAGDA
jgi:riboflavin kinase / FMN adenylyltransferase